MAQAQHERRRVSGPILDDARLSALSKVTGDLDLSTRRGDRVMQGLKMGMMHDDSPQETDVLRSVLRHFPLSPWD